MYSNVRIVAASVVVVASLSLALGGYRVDGDQFRCTITNTSNNEVLYEANCSGNTKAFCEVSGTPNDPRFVARCDNEVQVNPHDVEQ